MKRQLRWGVGTALVSLVLVSAGCSAAAEDHSNEREVVSQFFDLLGDGEAEGAGELLVDRAVVSEGALDDDLYDEAARPTDAEVTGAIADGSTVYVTVEYTLQGEDEPRETDVAVVDVDGSPRISGWLHDWLALDAIDVPGLVDIGGVLSVDLREAQELILLPGAYSFVYGDSEDVSTIDPDGAVAEPFMVAFPIDQDDLDLPPGVTMPYRSLVFEPTLRADVRADVDVQLAELLADCAASGLSSESCPPAFAAEIAARSYAGAVDAGSVAWGEIDALALVPGETWRVSGNSAVSFTRAGGAREQIDVVVTGEISRDASGAVVLSLVDA